MKNLPAPSSADSSFAEDMEARKRAKASVLALSLEACLTLAAEYREDDGAGRALSWDNEKGIFRDPMERIPFNIWLQKRLARSEAVESEPAKPL